MRNLERKETGMESQQVTFRETELKDEDYQKQRKNQLLKWLT